MKTILFVCPTHDIARTEFKECINRLTCQLTADNINHSKMQIKFDSAMYEFMSADALLPQVMGRTYSYMMIDEMVDLTEEVRSILMTRIEKTYQDQRNELHVVYQILEDLRGYSGVGEDGNPYDTRSWNAALKAVRDMIDVRLAHDDR
jgi:hypothetical protein